MMWLMETQINITLMQTLLDKSKIFLRYAEKLTRNPERAKDLVQHVALRLLEYPINFEVENDMKFLYTMVLQANHNKWRVEKKYLFLGDAHTTSTEESVHMERLLQDSVGCSFEGDLIESFKFAEVYNAAKELPKFQQEAIMNALYGNTVGEVELAEVGGNITDNPRYSSLKNNKRIAIQKLRDKLA